MLFKCLIFIGGVLMVQGGGGGGFSGYQQQTQGMSSYGGGGGGYMGGGGGYMGGGNMGGGGYNGGGGYMGSGRSMYDNGGGYNNGGFDSGYVIPMGSSDTTFLTNNKQKYGTSGGNAAAAGNAGAAGPGQASSINQANQHATEYETDSNGLSANTASGFGPQTSGAAQAGGQLSRASQGTMNYGRQSGSYIGRRR